MRRIFVFTLFLGLVSFVTSAPAAAFKRTSAGDALMDFQLETLKGDKLRLSESLGKKATLVIFWAAWSPRSAEILGDAQKLYAEHESKGLKVLAVNAEHAEWNPADEPKISSLIQQTGATYPILLDKGLVVFNDYGAVALPSAVLLNGDGKVAETVEGYPTAQRLELKERVLRELGELQPSSATASASSEPQGYAAKPKARRYLQMGLALMDKQPSHAVAALEKAVKEDPVYLDAYRALAQALKAAGKEKEAEAVETKIAGMQGQTPAAKEEKPTSQAAAVVAPPARPGN